MREDMKLSLILMFAQGLMTLCRACPWTSFEWMSVSNHITFTRENANPIDECITTLKRTLKMWLLKASYWGA
jgi:hypothetical protein